MKQLLLLSILSFFTIQLNAQACVPNEIYADSAVGVYPPPMNANNPDGGITESACVNKEYEFVFTFVVPDTVTLQGNDYVLDSVVIQPNGVLNLPAGISYACNPSSCTFTPEDSLGCLVIRGTADEGTEGMHDLKIKTMIYSSLGFPLPIEFPNNLFPGANGNYFLEVEPESSTSCFVVGTEDYLSKNIFVSNRPNPFSNLTYFEVHSKVNEVLNFQVFDMLGRRVHHDVVEIFEGANNFEFDGSRLNNGIYTYSLNNGKAAMTGKMVVNR